MLRIKLTVAVIALILNAATAFALPAPGAWLQIGGRPALTLPWTVDQSSKFPQISGFNCKTPEGVVRVHSKYDPDPFISYGLTAQNLTDHAVVFNFEFLAPMVPTPVSCNVTGHIAGTFTDHRGDGIEVTPMQADSDGDGIGEIGTNWLSATDQSGYVNAGVDVGASFAALPSPVVDEAAYAYGPYTAGPQAGPGGSGDWVWMRSVVNFSLSAYDEAHFEGNFTIDPVGNPVPEPGTFALFGLGLLAAGAAIRRRRTA